MFMSTSFDFTIISGTPINGISLVMPQNEDAYSYIVDELKYHVFEDGSAPLFTEAVGDFISDAEQAHMCCSYV